MDRKRAIFLTVIGPINYTLIQNLLSPVPLTMKTLEKIINFLNSHFDLAPFVIVETCKFNSIVQSVGESVTNFIAESLSKCCKYGTLLDEMLPDRIICGIQQKLLAEYQLILMKATKSQRQ